MKLDRIRVQLRISPHIIEKCKRFLPTKANGTFAGDCLSTHVEHLLLKDLEERNGSRTDPTKIDASGTKKPDV